MHSHDRTLLASLGFADKDKKLPEHDRACQYIMQQHIARKIADICGCPFSSTADYVLPEMLEVKARNEVMIAKGEGQYRSTIGFADVLLSVLWNVPHIYNECSNCYNWETRDKSRDQMQFVKEQSNILCEIKIAPASVGDMMRQIALYRNFLACKSVVLITAFELTSVDGRTLQNAKITTLRLGDDFARFCKSFDCNASWSTETI